MGTICILLGFIVFLGSIMLGFVGANAFMDSQWSVAFTSLPTGTELYVIFVGICGFIGLLICLNLVMHGLTYNKINKLSRKK